MCFSVAIVGARSVHGLDLVPEHFHLGGVSAGAPWKGEEDLVSGLGLEIAVVEVAVTTDSPGEVHVLLLDCHALGVDGAEVGVLEDADDVGLGGFLEGQKGLRLEPELMIHVGGNSSYKALEGSLREEHVDRLLIPLDLAEDNSTGPRSGLSPLLHAAGSGSSLLDGLGSGDLLCGGFGLGCDFSLGHLGGTV